MPHTPRTRAARFILTRTALLTALALTVSPAPTLYAQQVPRYPSLPLHQPPASTLPATPPTSQPQTAPIAATRAGVPAHRAEVTFADGLIDVRADNSSLHQILRAISRRTGMTIAGSIADDRVFGNYGPAEPSTILATLIDGAGVNMLYKAGDATHPPSLVLTPQTGSPVLINATPIAENADDESAQPAQTQPNRQPQQVPAQPQQLPARVASTPASAGANPPPTTSGTQNQVTNPPSIPQPLNNVNGSPSNSSPTASTLPTTNSVPIDSIPTPSTTPSTSGIVDSPNPPAPGSTTTPSGAATPEQIYQELLQMQQKQQKPSGPTTPSSTTTPPQ